jgi:asparagine synthetase B (glutamine-hydrolysing)
MPNLVGLWNPSLSKESIREMLGKQLRRVRIPGISYSEYRSEHPGFGMALMDHGLLENGEQPTTTSDGRYSLLFDGELCNADELKRRYRSGLSNFDLSTPHLCLQLLLQHGEDIVRAFNGLFCLALYDGHTRKLTLISDRYGFRPIYYKPGPDSFLFGSELKALCAADNSPRQVDEIGAAELFCYGTHFRERTWIEGYVRLAPATVLTLAEGRVQTRSYWIYKYQENAPTLDQPTYFTAFATLLDRAVERCMKGSKRIGIFLSGGYDSRSVAASIRKYHLPIPAITFGHGDSRDVRYATILAQRLGLDHSALTDRGPYLYPHCRAIVWRTEGMSSFANTTSIRYHPFMKSRMDLILTGFLAEFGGSHTWPKLLIARSRADAIPAIFQRFLGPRSKVAARVFEPSFVKRIFEAVRARFEASFAQVENEHPLNVADCWNLINLQPRSAYHSTSIDRHLFEARAPHMDAELVDFLLTIPPYSRLEQRIYKKMIYYRFPGIRDVPCTNSGLPINPHFAREYVAMVARYAARNSVAPFKRILHMQSALGREFRDLNDDVRAEPELADQILGPLLKEGIFPPNVFSYTAIEHIVQEHYKGAGNHENLICLLISWGLAAKYLLYENLSDPPVDFYQPERWLATSIRPQL